MADYPPRDVVSHSQLSGYIRCGKQFELERISKYPAPPTWYFIGGNAVHAATEALDRAWPYYGLSDLEALWAAAFEQEINEAFAIWPLETQWLKFGRRGSEQDYDYWNLRGE